MPYQRPRRRRYRAKHPKERVSVHIGSDTLDELERICARNSRSLSGQLCLLAENCVRAEREAAMPDLARRQNGTELAQSATA
jgi:hypothetical protein